jgi:hypothetical protein
MGSFRISSHLICYLEVDVIPPGLYHEVQPVLGYDRGKPNGRAVLGAYTSSNG